MAHKGPEHEEVRLPIIQALRTLGWSDSQIQWSPEWRVPRVPSEGAKREEGRGFHGFPVDLAVFDDSDQENDWQNLLGIFEFKEPKINAGLSQLETYLGLEPRARFGVWSNGTKSAIIYKLADGGFKTVRHPDLRLPSPGDDFELAATKALVYKDLTTPTERDLKASFKAMLDVVVARDSRSTRHDDQLDQLCNMLLLKLESDTNASLSPKKPVAFQLRKDEHSTGTHIRALFDELVDQREEVFGEEVSPDLKFDDQTIKDIVYFWSNWNLLDVGAEAVSSAFQVFRRANLKAGEGQYFTPARIIESAVMLMDIQPEDKIIDPACGTGGFLIEAFRGMSTRISGSSGLRTWAHRNVYGVDKDSISVKLARAMMMIMGDGSTHIHIGDSIREDRWERDYPHLGTALKDGTFSVVMTNPPFGENLKVAARDCAANAYEISKAAGKGKGYRDLEIGLVFLERAYRLLRNGGRLAIVLPETYFFSSTYAFLPGWLDGRLAVRGEFNVPMEAFQGFCRAKTNLYVFEKVGSDQ